MKCSVCGNEIKAGSLYCDNCGEDVHIVPDFDAEAEQAYAESIRHMTDELWESGRSKQAGDTTLPEDDTKDEEKRPESIKDKGVLKAHLKNHRLVFGGYALITVLVIFSIVFYNIAMSDGIQESRARTAINSGEYDLAASIYERLLDKNPGNAQYMLGLASAFKGSGNDDAYERTLWEVINLEGIARADKYTAYDRLFVLYASKGDYQGIADFLASSEDVVLKTQFSSFLGPEVKFSIEGGYYETPQLLRLTSDTEGVEIYYSTDGEQPTTESECYGVPILIDEGETTVMAFAVDKRGVIGERVSAEYHVTAQE